MTDRPGPWQPGWNPSSTDGSTYPPAQQSHEPDKTPGEESPSRMFGKVAAAVMVPVIAVASFMLGRSSSERAEETPVPDTPDLTIGAGDQLYIDFPTQTPGHPCTIAAVGEGDQGKFAITTGYCVPVAGQQVAHRGESIGTVSLSEVNIGDYSDRFQPGGNSYDYALISMSNSVTLRSSGARVERPDMGESVCMEGSVSGRQCGVVSITPAGTVHVQGMEARSGDQGAPLYSQDGEILYGMLSQLATPRMDDLIFVSMQLTLSQLRDSEPPLIGDLK